MCDKICYAVQGQWIWSKANKILKKHRISNILKEKMIIHIVIQFK